MSWIETFKWIQLSFRKACGRYEQKMNVTIQSSKINFRTRF